MKKLQVAILISGRGSNMRALIDAACQKDFPAQIVGVISNRPKADGLNYAQAHNIPTFIIDHKAYQDRTAFEAALQKVLFELETELICNAGFMRLLTAPFVAAWHNRQINIHPSLLPAYKGLKTHQRVLEDGVRITGCTVHFVRHEMDQGPIIAQAAVPVLPDDTEETLADRVLAAEHKLYPQALSAIAKRLIYVEEDQVIFADHDAETVQKTTNLLMSPFVKCT